MTDDKAKPKQSKTNLYAYFMEYFMSLIYHESYLLPTMSTTGIFVTVAYLHYMATS